MTEEHDMNPVRLDLIGAILDNLEDVLGLEFGSFADWRIMVGGRDGNIRFEVVEDGIASKYIWTLNIGQADWEDLSITEVARHGLEALKPRLIQRGILKEEEA